MAPFMKVYSASEISISVCGIPITKGGPGGIADGDFLKIVYDTDFFTDKVGADGSVVREATNDFRAVATLVLMQSSDGNDTLSNLLNSDTNAPNGAGVGSFQVKDGNGSTILRSQFCWIKKPADISFGKESGNREWPIRCAALKGTIGGNISPVGRG